MYDEYAAEIMIGDKKYRLILTTRATREISVRYNGLENLGDKLLKGENFEMALSEIVWLLTILANQGVMLDNLKNKDSQEALLTEEVVELMTTPYEIASYKNAIIAAMFNGTKRDVLGENSKNSDAV